MPEENPYRLPRTVVPERYELTLTPDLEQATFHGEAVITAEVRERVDEVVLNSIELDITEAVVGGQRAEVRYDEETERAFLRVAQPLEPGPLTLELRFTGILNDKLAGFYRSTYRDDDGVEHVIATTQMEATDARRAFPCWDEPDLKAVFAVRLVVPQDLLALSNGPEVERVPAGDGLVKVVFADTIKMSTYLVAFIVGPLDITDPVDVDGVALRVAHVPGKGHMAGFALDAGAACLRFFSDWFGIGYPGRKLDLVALPDFAFGAMENLGCVTFRETALLVDPDNASRLEFERVADVVAHEIAHMWFGDLVTMKWWEGIWLNEAFATFMELLAVDDFKPEWQRWVSFSTSRAAAMQTDGLAATRPIEFPVVKPEDANAMFDILTYQKGAAVLRMLERFLGGDAFRDGLRRYIAAHQYGNTATSDLWDALESATGEPVRSTMDSWILQGGHPLVSVDVEGDGRRLTLQQRRFRYRPSPDDAGARWAVPLQLRFATPNGDVEHRKLLLTDGSVTVDLPGKLDWVVVNDGGWGFFRTRYAADLLRSLTGPQGPDLSAIERFNLVSDTWASVLAGLAPVQDFIELAEPMGDERDPDVWAAILSPFDTMERALLARGLPTDGLAAFVRRLVEPAFACLGWDPAVDEDERTGTLRATLLAALGGTGADDRVRGEALRRFEALETERDGLSPDLVTAVVTILSKVGGEGEYTRFLERYRAPVTPQDEVRYLLALAGFRHEALVRRTRDMLLTPEVRSQNAAFLVSALLANPSAGESSWRWLKEHWDQVLEKLPDNSHTRMLGGVPTLARPELAADVEAFLTEHPIKGGRQAVPQLLELLRVTTAFTQDQADAVAAAFDGRE